MSMRQKTVTTHVLLLCLIVTFVVGLRVGLSAQSGPGRETVSCADTYARFVNESWSVLETCILDTNSLGIGQRFPLRMACHARWASNALQAEAEYISCMSIGAVATRLMGR